MGSSVARYVCGHVYTCCSSSGFSNTNIRLLLLIKLSMTMFNFSRSYGTGIHTKLGRYSSSVVVIRVREDGMRPRPVAPTVWVTLVVPGAENKSFSALPFISRVGRLIKIFDTWGLLSPVCYVQPGNSSESGPSISGLPLPFESSSGLHMVCKWEWFRSLLVLFKQ
jgi:hypothetical protein